MTAQLLAIIACALFVVAYMERRHERAMSELVQRFSQPVLDPYALIGISEMHTTGTEPLTPRQILGFDNARHMPFLLERQLVRMVDVQPTRRMAHPIHPRFEAYGVDVSVHPTIGVD